ncbi:MAG: tRNA-dihydrouridine synthase [Holophagaceae bacterium]|nr:tRNA-dihydrouridine synthase [Holophagaceae bacterium]
MDFSQSEFAIGSLVVKPALALAPLHEITDQAFRIFIREVGGLGLTVSEMVSCEALIRKAHKAEKMLAGDGGFPFAVQIVGSRPEAMAEAAKIATQSGANIVDINMGCPASNITSGLAGSAMLRDILKAENCIKSVISAVTVPVTVKMRIGWDETQKSRGDYLEFLKMYENNGISAVTIHPRTRAQQYSGKADWSFIAKAVELGMSYPIIGNGDVILPDDATRMVAETGCSGVMIGRGAMYNPFIFKQILTKVTNISHVEKINLTIRFFEIVMSMCDEKETLHKMKKFSGLFTKGIPNCSVFRQKLNILGHPTEILKELELMVQSSKQLQSTETSIPTRLSS